MSSSKNTGGLVKNPLFTGQLIAEDLVGCVLVPPPANSHLLSKGLGGEVDQFLGQDVKEPENDQQVEDRLLPPPPPSSLSNLPPPPSSLTNFKPVILRPNPISCQTKGNTSTDTGTDFKQIPLDDSIPLYNPSAVLKSIQKDSNELNGIVAPLEGGVPLFDPSSVGSILPHHATKRPLPHRTDHSPAPTPAALEPAFSSLSKHISTCHPSLVTDSGPPLPDSSITLSRKSSDSSSTQELHVLNSQDRRATSSLPSSTSSPSIQPFILQSTNGPQLFPHSTSSGLHQSGSQSSLFPALIENKAGPPLYPTYTEHNNISSVRSLSSSSSVPQLDTPPFQPAVIPLSASQPLYQPSQFNPSAPFDLSSGPAVTSPYNLTKNSYQAPSQTESVTSDNQPISSLFTSTDYSIPSFLNPLNYFKRGSSPIKPKFEQESVQTNIPNPSVSDLPASSVSDYPITPHISPPSSTLLTPTASQPHSDITDITKPVNITPIAPPPLSGFQTSSTLLSSLPKIHHTLTANPFSIHSQKKSVVSPALKSEHYFTPISASDSTVNNPISPNISSEQVSSFTPESVNNFQTQHINTATHQFFGAQSTSNTIPFDLNRTNPESLSNKSPVNTSVPATGSAPEVSQGTFSSTVLPLPPEISILDPSKNIPLDSTKAELTHPFVSYSYLNNQKSDSDLSIVTKVPPSNSPSVSHQYPVSLPQPSNQPFVPPALANQVSTFSSQVINPSASTPHLVTQPLFSDSPQVINPSSSTPPILINSSPSNLPHVTNASLSTPPQVTYHPLSNSFQVNNPPLSTPPQLLNSIPPLSINKPKSYRLSSIKRPAYAPVPDLSVSSSPRAVIMPHQPGIFNGLNQGETQNPIAQPVTHSDYNLSQSSVEPPPAPSFERSPVPYFGNRNLLTDANSSGVDHSLQANENSVPVVDPHSVVISSDNQGEVSSDGVGQLVVSDNLTSPLITEVTAQSLVTENVVCPPTTSGMTSSESSTLPCYTELVPPGFDTDLQSKDQAISSSFIAGNTSSSTVAQSISPNVSNAPNLAFEVMSTNVSPNANMRNSTLFSKPLNQPDSYQTSSAGSIEPNPISVDQPVHMVEPTLYGLQPIGFPPPLSNQDYQSGQPLVSDSPVGHQVAHGPSHSVSYQSHHLPEQSSIDSIGSASTQPYAYTAMAVSQTYRAVYHHWFYRRPISNDTKSLWIPFSMADSLNLEQQFSSTTGDEGTSGNTSNRLVATDGGRYDVDVEKRTRRAVYWQEDEGQVRRCSWFVKGPVDSRYQPYDENIAELLEEEYKAACTRNEWNRRVELSDGEVIIIHSPNSIQHHQRSSSPDPWGNTPPIAEKPRIVKRGLDEFDIPEGEPTQVDHLILLVHGIGKVCDLRFRSLVEVVDDLRSISVSLVGSHYRGAVERGKAGRVEVLPVEWHQALHTEQIDQRLNDITLPSIPRARQFTNETLLDILFYTSPVFCEKIVQAVGAELNRVYSLYMERNPGYKGGVSLGGHSLGSLILFDMLCHQKPIHPKLSHQPSVSLDEDDEDIGSLGCLKTRARLSRRMSYVTIGTAGTGQPYIQYPQLIFQPRHFFALGSPIGMFVTVRGIESLGQDFRFPTCPSFLNIFHPNDPVAYRIEGLIDPAMAKHPAVLIPHHKGRKRMHLELKETMAHVTAALKQKLVDSVKNTWNTVSSLARLRLDHHTLQTHVDKVLEDEMMCKERSDGSDSETESNHNTDPEPDGSDIRVGKLNGGRRIDYVLQEAPLETFNQYISAVRSHLVYWESEDTMLLILKEIYNVKGISCDTQVPQPILPFDLSAQENADPGTAYSHYTVASTPLPSRNNTIDEEI